MAGAGFGIPLSIVKAYYDTSASEFHMWKMLSPAFLSKPLTAWEYLTEQQAIDAKGNLLAKFDLENEKQVNEIMAQALGFNVRRVALKQEANWAYKQAFMYYQRRHREFYRLFAEAVLNGDDKAKADVLRRVNKWNASVPPDLRVKEGGLVDSVVNKATTQARAKLDLPAENTGVPLKRRIDSLFPGSKLSGQGDNPYVSDSNPFLFEEESQ